LSTSPKYASTGIGVLEIAQEETIGVGLARGLVEECEGFVTGPEGVGIVRDDGPDGNRRWWVDCMSGYRWEELNAGKEVERVL